MTESYMTLWLFQKVLDIKLLIVLDVAQLQGGDVRQELKTYGKEGTGKKYLEI